MSIRERRLYCALVRAERLLDRGADSVRAVTVAATSELADEDALARVLLRKVIACDRAREQVRADARIEGSPLYAPHEAPPGPEASAS